MNSVPTNTAEEWRDIEGFEGHYQVSNLGRVKSLVGWNGREHIKREKILKPSMTTTGYFKVDLRNKDAKKKSLKLHRVVATAFIPNPNGYAIINHKDGNPLNNNIENLEWCTQKYNVEHAIRTGHHHYCIAHTQKEIEVCELYRQGKSVRAIAQMYGVSPNAVSSALKRFGVEQYPKGHFVDKYHVNLEELKKDFDKGVRNRDLAEKYNCPSELIARRKWQYKKGEI